MTGHVEEKIMKKILILLRFWDISITEKNRILSGRRIVRLIDPDKDLLEEDEYKNYLKSLVSKYCVQLYYRKRKYYTFTNSLEIKDVLSESRNLLVEYRSLKSQTQTP